MCLLFVDDIVLIDETKVGVNTVTTNYGKHINP